jgi:isoaspartyl peptidase/L-asparaginase-like protein (Ntn-hydrolase superfamily)
MKLRSRRRFIADSILLTASGVVAPYLGLRSQGSTPGNLNTDAIVVSTWNFGMKANKEAWKVIENEGLALDAVESGIRSIESDPSNQSVGIGGFPDRDGHVTLDACIMDHEGKAGSVAFLEDIMNPISVARKVMENTPHVMLAGKGAQHFALANGFERVDLLTEASKQAWKNWQAENEYKPVINIENHDTIGLLCLDTHGNLGGGCSTSGLAFKMHGRVGDSPIIGAALYVDNEVGAAVTTGLGELVMRSLSAFLVVELMRNGASAREACKEAISRIVKKNPDYAESQVGIIALSKSGETSAFAIHPGFNFAKTTRDEHILITANSFLN